MGHAGYSRAADSVDARQFYEVARDIQVAAGFVRRYVTQYQRWLSPKYLCGESYGVFRAAGLAVLSQVFAVICLIALVVFGFTRGSWPNFVIAAPLIWLHVQFTRRWWTRPGAWW